MYPTHGKELGPQVRIALVFPSPECGAGQGGSLADAPHLGAEVISFKIHGHPVRTQHRLQGIGDLLPDALLHREALGKQAHQARELGNADDLLVRDISHVGMPMKREGMMPHSPKKWIGPSTTWLRRQSGPPRHSVSNTVSNLGSPSYPSVASNKARRKRCGVCMVAGVFRSNPNASKMAATSPSNVRICSAEMWRRRRSMASGHPAHRGLHQKSSVYPSFKVYHCFLPLFFRNREAAGRAGRRHWYARYRARQTPGSPVPASPAPAAVPGPPARSAMLTRSRTGGETPRISPDRVHTRCATRGWEQISFSHRSTCARSLESPRGQSRSTSTRVPSPGFGSS